MSYGVSIILADVYILFHIHKNTERRLLCPLKRPLRHPLGASGARLVTTAMNRLHASNGRYALCTMCIGVGQGIALIIERV